MSAATTAGEIASNINPVVRGNSSRFPPPYPEGRGGTIFINDAGSASVDGLIVASNASSAAFCWAAGT
jgi:hypothetical protein